MDKRTDIWAFGCVVYEMLTGRRAFDGDDVTDVLARVIERAPDFSALKEVTPPVVRMLSRCLEKDRKNRLADIADAKLDIIEASGWKPISAPRRSWRLISGWRVSVTLLAVFVAGLIAAGVGIRRYLSPSPTPQTRFEVPPPDKAIFFSGDRAATLATISPDGRRVAFTARDENSKTSLWFRSLDALSAQPIPNTDNAQFPFWSPDGRFIGFFARDKLWKVSAGGGPPQMLCDAPGPRGGSWNRDGVIVFLANSRSLRRVSAAGGEASDVTRPEFGDDRFPSFLPDGKHVLIYNNRNDMTSSSGVHVVSLESGKAKRLLAADSSALYSHGHLLFVRQSTLLAQPFDLGSLELSGDPFPIAEGLETFAYAGVPSFSVSDGGVLAYGTGENRGSMTQLMWFDRAGKALGSVAAFRHLSNRRRSELDERIEMNDTSQPG